MITGEIKSQIDRVWDAFWSGGISNPLEVIEQITYLLFLRRLDDLHTLAENKSARLKKPIERRIFPKGKDDIGKGGGRSYEDLRWSHFKNMSPGEMYDVIGQHAFPFLRTLGGDDSTYAHHMKDARFTVPTPALLAKVVDLLDDVPMEKRDTNGDLYEYMLGKIASAGQNGQFRTPRHIIRLMVEMTAPQPTDVICDPACGTAGFLVAAGEYIRERHPNVLHDAKLKAHFHKRMFHGFDFDNTMLRIGSMNMLLHGVENPDIRYRDSLAEEHAGDEETYTLVLANPPFAGSLDYENTAKNLQQVVKTKKTELLFVALFLRLLKPGGRAAVIVPDGVLFGSSKAHKELRRMLVEEQKLDAVVSLMAAMNLDNFIVRPRRRVVEKYAKPEAWVTAFSSDALLELSKEVAGLPSELDPEGEDAKRFDLLLLNLQLARLRSEPAFERLRDQVKDIAGLLEEKSAIPMVRMQMALILDVQTDEWWQDVTVPMLEVVRRRLRELVKLIEKKRRKPLFTDFEDAMGPETGVMLTAFGERADFAKFRAKARSFLRAHQDHVTIQKLRTNRPLTSSDLSELERMLAESGVGATEDIDRARTEAAGLGVFVRSLVGLERAAAKEALAAFMSGKTLTANQIDFIDLIVNHLTEHGVMEVALLYESPFTDLTPKGPDGLFTPPQVDELIDVLAAVRATAIAA